jgi:hypothetical protein
MPRNNQSKTNFTRIVAAQAQERQRLSRVVNCKGYIHTFTHGKFVFTTETQRAQRGHRVKPLCNLLCPLCLCGEFLLTEQNKNE